tara:strand:- start:710 stop:1255 length:546 start_codon:yes stop_codon:yes gene_type:complete
MKIYTKNGDQGFTQLLAGEKVSKDNIRIECYGSIDELNAHIGNIYDQNIHNNHKHTLLSIQNTLFNLGSNIAFDPKNKGEAPINITEDHVLLLEKEIDSIESSLEELRSFILPSGNDVSSKCHIARTICRRAERNLISLSKKEKVHFVHIKYLNRLSDYLFVLARKILKENGVKEIVWEKS